jgi:hypothetical protein
MSTLNQELKAQINGQIYKMNGAMHNFLIDLWFKGIPEGDRERIMNAPQNAKYNVSWRASHLPSFRNNYIEVQDYAKKLLDGLYNACTAYRQDNNLQEYIKACQKAVDIAQPAFEKHRGTWSEVPAILKKFLGVLAALTIIPALIVQSKSTHGYYQTFFGENLKTRSLKFLEENCSNLLAQISEQYADKSNHQISPQAI